MKIKILSVGKLKEKYLKDGINEYKKRLTSYTNIELIEVLDEKIPEHASIKEEEIVKDKEGIKLLKHIKDTDYVILLDVQGQMIDSIELSKTIENLMIHGNSTIVFVLGGSLGHGKDIKKRANMSISMSKMTFPHQLARLILIEQIYRSFKIMKNETYHK